MKKLFVAMILLAGITPANASIKVFKCSFSNMREVFFTIYDDGTPPRIGVSQGVGNKGWVVYDKLAKAFVIVETNTDNIPVTMTTINSKGQAVHSRQYIDVLGEIVAPSQGNGSCQDLPVETGIR